MAIKVHNNKIVIGNYTLQETTGGLAFDGIVRADSYNRVRLFQGTVAGFTAGGYFSPPVSGSNIIEKFPFPTNANASDVGDLVQGRYAGAGASSATHGYVAGGATVPPTTSVNTIDKFLFSSNLNAFNVGNLLTARHKSSGQTSPTQGYASGGVIIPTPGTFTNVIERYPFAQDVQSFDVADLTVARRSLAGHSSTEKGYASGGTPSNNTIDSFPFSNSESVCTDVGDLTQGRYGPAGHSSTVSGYSSGGFSPPRVTTIDKFPFATNSNATSVGNLINAGFGGSGTSSNLSGYTAGGSLSPGPTAVIEKFSFASDGNSTPVGNLTAARSEMSSVGSQF